MVFTKELPDRSSLSAAAEVDGGAGTGAGAGAGTAATDGTPSSSALV